MDYLRIGFGFDAHRFCAPGDSRPLILGGIKIPHSRGLEGHSDADVLTHAICDALLGAVGLGDIGKHFPDSDPQWKNARSVKLLATVYDKVRAAPLPPRKIVNIDATVVAQAPKIAPHEAAIKKSLSIVLQIDAERINIKATTTERMGFAGRGEGIAACAAVLLSI